MKKVPSPPCSPKAFPAAKGKQMTTQRTVRPEVTDFKKYTPGLTAKDIADHYSLSQVIKLASNENPLGISPLAKEAIKKNAALAFRYAQAGTPELCMAIAKHLGVSSEHIVAGNGSDELIDLLIRVKARPGKDNIIAFSPCFSIYKLQAQLCGIEFRQTPLREDFSFPFENLVSLADENTVLCFVTSPDNPSGRGATVRELETLAKALPPQCILVVDEAYIEFAPDQNTYSLLPRLGKLENVALLRTFSKMYGLAGLRLGYGVLPPWLADYCQRIKLPFSVNSLAEAAGIAALQDTHFVEATREVVERGRAMLSQEFTTLGCLVYPSVANFLLITLPESAGISACKMFEVLLAKGIILRPLAAGYNMPHSLRISIGNNEENTALLSAVKEILKPC